MEEIDRIFYLIVKVHATAAQDQWTQLKARRPQRRSDASKMYYLLFLCLMAFQYPSMSTTNRIIAAYTTLHKSIAC